MTEPFRVINFGAGVQSTAMLALVVNGKLPKPDRIIMADTGWEPPEVYEHARDCAQVASLYGIPFDIVRLADIRQDHINRAAGLPVNSGYRVHDPSVRAMRAIPLFTRLNDVEYNKRLGRWECDKNESRPGDGRMPPRPVQNGMLRRSCTERYKVQPIQRRIRQLLREAGTPKRQIEQWFGISTDERERERISQKAQWSFRYPLLYDVPMSRRACIELLTSMGITAPKSACVGCPYRNRTQWEYIRTRPDLWADAVDFDRKIRHMPGLDAECFLHPQRVPLDQVNWTKMGERQEHAGMVQDCVGMCGV